MMMLLFAAAAAGQSPQTFVERLYDSYRNENYSPFEHSERVFAPQLNAAIKEDERLAHGDVGFLDGDPICACQDTGGMHSRLVSVSASGRSATAHVLLKWDGDKESRDVRLNLVRTPAGWRVADVGTSDEPSLLKDLQDANRKARKH